MRLLLAQSKEMDILSVGRKSELSTTLSPNTSCMKIPLT